MSMGRPKGGRNDLERDWLPDQVLRDTHARLLRLLSRTPAETQRQFSDQFWRAYDEASA